MFIVDEVLLLQTMEENSQEIQFELVNNGAVGTILLTRPRALNALTLDMIRRMTSVLTRWEKDDQVKMIIVKGEGDRAFCSGGDVKSIANAKGETFQTDFIREEYKLDYLISQLSTPYISVWDGVVMGGGVGISRMGHIRIATERTVFAMPECSIGIVPDIGACYFLPQLPGKLGLFLGVTGTRMTGWECRKYGLATHYIRSEHVDHVLESLTSITSPDLRSISQVLVEKETGQPIEKRSDYLSENLDEINGAFNSQTYSEVIQKLKANKNSFSEETLSKISSSSPTSQALTFKQLSLATGSYKEALEIDFRLMSQRFQDPDFYEGVRAALIDKDGNPSWSPKTQEEVDEAAIEKYFAKQSIELDL